MPLAKGHDTSRGTDYGGGKCTSLTWQTWKTLPFSRHETRDWFEKFFFIARFKTVLRVQILQRGHEKFQILQDMFVFQAVGSTPTYRIRSVRTMKIWVRRCFWTPQLEICVFSAIIAPSITFEITTKKMYIFGTVDRAAARATQLKLLRTHPASFGPFPLPPPNFSALLLFCFFDANMWWKKSIPLKIIKSSQTIMFFALKKTGKLLLFSDFTLTVFPMLDVLRRSEGLGDDWSISVDTRIPWHHGYGSWQL